MTKVRWTRAAQRQLREIVGYIARDSPRAAAELASRIKGLSEKIADQPLAGQIVPEIGDPVIRERRAGPYRVIYSLAVSSPKILAVYHRRRLLSVPPADEL